MTVTEAYIKDKGKEGRAPRQIYKGTRRQQVASLYEQGYSQRAIAEKLNIGKSTVARDLKWLKTSEHQLRAQETAQRMIDDDVVEAEIVEITSRDDFSLEAMRERERNNVVALIAKKNTYEEVANKLGISISTVVRHVNAYLAEYGDWGGRTQMDWRNEQIIGLYKIMANALDAMETEPIPAVDNMGDGDKGWDLTPYQAEKIKSDARRDWMAAQKQQAQLLQLLVQQVEVKKEERVVVVNLRDVDTSVFPKQDLPRLVG